MVVNNDDFVAVGCLQREPEKGETQGRSTWASHEGTVNGRLNAKNHDGDSYYVELLQATARFSRIPLIFLNPPTG